eukprot:TRINITY_DN10388_c0_g1_i1.p1 TRINITY_DN10388_c0_g1~~TRINITY_DN10388_c0_g1_i1.p1  ORF type:complete len:280 (-),score=23.93 TRINITY_DN10388_c0_g1_i1:28-867(-)
MNYTSSTSPLLSQTWEFILNSKPEFISQRLFFSLWMSSTHFLLFWSLNLLFEIFRRNKIFQRYRINNDKMPDKKLVLECIKNLLFNELLLVPNFYMLFPIFQYFGMSMDPYDIPPWYTILGHVIVCVLVEDFLFYWTHRMFHLKSPINLYKNVHKKHHRFQVSLGIASEYAHPIENIANAFCSLAGPMLLGSHALTTWLWIQLRITETIFAHSGYALPSDPFGILPFQRDTRRHDFHHSRNVGSYGSWTPFWDWLMGTNKPFESWLKQNEANQSKTKSE